MLHHIQKTVINALATNDPARYAALKPADMDGNQFTYHLKQLISENLVKKNDDGTYSLTQTGRTYLINRYENLNDQAHSIILMIIRNGDRYLLRRRKIQPLIGYAGFVHGEPTANQSLEATVRERVTKKTGLEIKELTPYGSGLIHMSKDGETQSFSHAIIVECWSKSDELLITEDETGENFWVTRTELDPIDKLLPSTEDILGYVADSKRRWFDWKYEV